MFLFSSQTIRVLFGRGKEIKRKNIFYYPCPFRWKKMVTWKKIKRKKKEGNAKERIKCKYHCQTKASCYSSMKNALNSSGNSKLLLYWNYQFLLAWHCTSLLLSQINLQLLWEHLASNHLIIVFQKYSELTAMDTRKVF